NTKVYNYLLYEILSGEYELGEKVLINQLAEKYEVSTTPIREALSKLENEGVLIKHPYKSYEVRDFTFAEIEELYEARSILEIQAARLAARRITPAKIDKFQEILAAGKTYIEAEEFGKFNNNNADFHFYIFAASDNSYLMEMMQDIHKQIMLLTLKAFTTTERPRDSLQEHKQIFAGLVEGREEQVKGLMEKHLWKSLERLKEIRD
ncbi:MAG: GntR family transcriptional regulator, partial [Bacillota bacterium]